MSKCKHYDIDCPSWDSENKECLEEFPALLFVNPQEWWEWQCQKIRNELEKK